MLGSPQVGDRIGRFVITARLGRGGMGTVYAATDTSLERDVALKLINADLAEDPDFRARFHREAVAMSRIDSPHIVTVHEQGEVDGSLYLVTQLVRGGDLAAAIGRDGAVAPGRALTITEQLLDGLASAHAAGIVHRDIKPSNVLLDASGETAYLCDFGIAALPGAELTRTGGLVGSLGYMAPERHSGDKGAATLPAGDVYGVGCVLWAMLTGSAPYVGSDVEVAMGHLHGPVPQLPGTEPAVAAINDVLRGSLAKDPAARFGTAAAMREAVVAARRLDPGQIAPPEHTSYRHPLTVPPAPLPMPGAAAAAVPSGREHHRLRRGLPLVLTSVIAIVAVVIAVLALSRGVPTSIQALTDSPTTPASSSTAPLRASSASPEVPRRSREQDGTVRTRPKRGAPTSRTSSAPPAASGQPTSGPHHHASQPPRAAPTAPATSAQPTAHYACWNGTKAATLSACGYPSGVTGMRWMWSGMKSLSCHTYDISGTTAEREAWLCTYDGHSYITLARWSSSTAARRFYESKSGSGTSWYCNNTSVLCGRRKYWTSSDRYFYWRAYSASDYWSANINATSSTSRSHGVHLMGTARMPGEIRGRSL